MERERQALAGERERRLSELRTQISRQLLDERQRLSSETEQAKVALESDARNLAVQISQQILHRPVTGQGTT